MDFFNTLLYQPLYQALVYIYEQVGDLGVAIILLTLFLRVVLLPLTMPSLRAMKKMRDLQPKIDELKRKHKGDKQALQQAQMDLFQKEKVNPAAGCLPQIFQIVVFIGLYQVFVNFLEADSGQLHNTYFLGIDLTQPDPTYILPIIAGVSQLILGLMMSPAPDTTKNLKAVAEHNDNQPPQKESKEDMTAMAASMQQQMIFIMPLFTVFISTRFPAGLALYWVVSTIFSLIQQYFVTGWGATPQYISLAQAKLKRRHK